MGEDYIQTCRNLFSTFSASHPICLTSRVVPDDETSSDSNRFASTMTDRVASSATAAKAVYHLTAVRSSDALKQTTDRASGACNSMVQLRTSGVATLRQTKHRRSGIILQSPAGGEPTDPLSAEASMDGPVQPISARNDDLRKYGVTSLRYFTKKYTHQGMLFDMYSTHK